MLPRGLHGLLAAAGTRRASCQSRADGAHLLGTRSLVLGPLELWDNNRQLPTLGRGLRAFKGLEVCGEKEPPDPGPPYPLWLAFCLEICAPLPPRINIRATRAF